MGLTAGEAAGVTNSIQTAGMFSLTVSAQEAATAAKDMSDAFGSAQHINRETLKDVVELTNLLGDGAGAVRLQETFEQAGVDASDMTDEIKDIARGVGVNAAAVLKDMASQQNQMLGMSKEEIKVMAQKSAELVKQGLSMDKLRGMSDNMLNIEGNILAQQKARAFGLGEMLPDQQAMFAAANELQFGDAQKGAEMMTAALAESGITAEKFGSLGFKQQQIYADAIGMSADELGTMLQTQEKNNELVGKFGPTGAEAFNMIASGAMTVGSMLGEMLKTLGMFIVQYAVMNKIQTGNTGLKNLLPGKGGGGGPQTKAPQTPKIDPKSGGGMSGLTGAIEKIDGKKLMAGGAALLLVAAAVFVFGKAVQEFMKVWQL